MAFENIECTTSGIVSWKQDEYLCLWEQIEEDSAKAATKCFQPAERMPRPTDKLEDCAEHKPRPAGKGEFAERKPRPAGKGEFAERKPRPADKGEFAECKPTPAGSNSSWAICMALE